MENHRIESVRIAADFERIFNYVSNPANLPEWTHAFKQVRNGKAVLATPNGSVEIGLKTESSPSAGTIDWHMTMPDGTLASAFSRLIRESPRHCIFTFILMAPPVPLEALEGTLSQQAATLREELAALRRILSVAGN
jgi:hypothetical protein